jgi:hypothetical protein
VAKLLTCGRGTTASLRDDRVRGDMRHEAVDRMRDAVPLEPRETPPPHPCRGLCWWVAREARGLSAPVARRDGAASIDARRGRRWRVRYRALRRAVVQASSERRVNNVFVNHT